MELLPHLTQRVEVMKMLLWTAGDRVFLWIADVGSSVLLLRQKREMNTDFQPSVSTLNSWMRYLPAFSRTSISSD